MISIDRGFLRIYSETIFIELEALPGVIIGGKNFNGM